jgi:predicted ATP-grasp superfamily ATP-dependent carboligase
MSTIIIYGDSHVALAITRSLGRKKIHTTVVARVKHAMAFYSKYCDHRVISPFDLDFFLRLSEDDIVMPMDEDVMLLLSKNKMKCKCKLPFPDYPTLEKVINKSLLVKHAIKNNIPTPKTHFVNKSDDLDEISKELNFPVLIKPVRGSGGGGITCVDSPDVFKGVYKHVLNKYGVSIIQEKIPYSEKYTVAALFNKDSRVKRVCVLKQIKCYPATTGPATMVESVEKPDVLKLTLRLLESLDYYGMAEVELVVDERNGKLVLIEINPRFWGSLQGAISAGVDFPYLLYRMIEDGDIDASLSYKTGIKCRNAIFKDMHHVRTILKGNYPLNNKLSSLIDFFKFYQDDSYYIFSLEDIKPFLSLLIYRGGYQRLLKIIGNFFWLV